MGIGASSSNLKYTIGSAFAIQAACAAVAIPLQTEKFYDLSGSLTFISCTLVSLYFPHLRHRAVGTPLFPLPPISSFHVRQLAMSGAVIIWATRLGTFLFERIHRSGKDVRFDEIKQSPVKFAGAWTAQAVWISLTALPVFVVNAIPTQAQAPLGRRDALAAALWVGAFAWEVIADRQKSDWRERKNQKLHDEEFITSGLWSKSRHPNYAGEVALWSAQFLGSTAALYPSTSAVIGTGFPPWMAIAMIASPLAEYALIRYVSGVPILEASADKRFGGQKKYEEYKKNTPVFFPKLF